jgi:hypothetical protein
MKPFYLIVVSVILTSSCGHKKQAVALQDTSSAVRKKLEIPAANKPAADTNSAADTIVDTTQKLLQYSCRNVFSDPAAKDSLVLTLYGKHIENGNFVFEIWNIKGKRLFRQVFNSYDMLIDLDGESTATKQDSVKKYAAHFFDPSNFQTPAIDANEKFDDDFSSADESDRKVWKQIKADNSSVGFLYSYGYEGTSAIAWSKTAKKVIEVFYSD